MPEHEVYEIEVHKVPKQWKERAFIDKDAYEKLYEKSIEKPDEFWGERPNASIGSSPMRA